MNLNYILENDLLRVSLWNLGQILRREENHQPVQERLPDPGHGGGVQRAAQVHAGNLCDEGLAIEVTGASYRPRRPQPRNRSCFQQTPAVLRSAIRAG